MISGLIYQYYGGLCLKGLSTIREIFLKVLPCQRYLSQSRKLLYIMTPEHPFSVRETDSLQGNFFITKKAYHAQGNLSLVGLVLSLPREPKIQEFK